MCIRDSVIIAGVIFYLVFFTSPRMRVQLNIRAFEAVMPNAPDDSVPLEEVDFLPAGRTAPTFQPSPATTENIRKGEVYYGYYCLFCHGEKGDGEGPVGQSYMPEPPDLRTEKVRKMSDEELLRAMLLGTGHEPVINRVVPPPGYEPLVLFVRALNGQGG